MSYLSSNTASQTVTVATETALASTARNEYAIPTGAQVTVFGTVNCATGTGGTIAALKVRQGSATITGTQVGATLTGPTQTANMAQQLAYSVVDNAPPADGMYTVTLTFTGNSSSVVTSTITTLVDTGVLGN
jgi:hypothetical protein